MASILTLDRSFARPADGGVGPGRRPCCRAARPCRRPAAPARRRPRRWPRTPARRRRRAVGPGGAASGLRPPGAPPATAAAAPVPPGGLRPFADVVKDAKRTDGTLARLAEGREGLARAQARRLQQAVLPVAEAQVRHRRAHVLRRADGRQRHRRVPPRPQPGAADLAQRRLRRQAEHAGSAGDRGGLLAQPAVERAGAEPARAGAQVGAGRGQQPVPLRPARHRHGPAARVPPGLFVRSAQLGDHRRFASRPTCSCSRCSATTRPASIAVPQPGTPPGAPQPSAPRSLPDPRSMFLSIHYSLARLPAEPMHGRKADARIGYFESGRYDFSDDLQRTPRQRFVNRWRLEKKDPAAALSEPVKPIVFWIDRTVPVKYRRADHCRRARVEQGVREDRLQGRDPGRDPARRRRLRHARLRPRLDPLDDQRVAVVRRHRPEPRRSAQRRDPRRRHRHREPVVAQPAHPALADPGAWRATTHTGTTRSATTIAAC